MKQTRWFLSRFLSRFFKYQDRLRTKNKCKESSSKKKTPSQGSRRRAHRMRKNGLFGAIYIYLKRSRYQDRLGTNIAQGKHSKRHRFLRSYGVAAPDHHWLVATQPALSFEVKNGTVGPFLLYKNAIILPRQARDKHRESTQKKTATVFF